MKAANDSGSFNEQYHLATVLIIIMSELLNVSMFLNVETTENH